MHLYPPNSSTGRSAGGRTLQVSSARLEGELAREGREIATLLYTRSQFLKDTLANLMHLICSYDATIHKLASLSGAEGREALNELEGALVEADRDGLLAEMLRMLERSGIEAADLEEISATLEALQSPDGEEIGARDWAELLLGQIRTASRGRISTRLQVPESERLPGVPSQQGDLVASLVRSLSERTLEPGRLSLTLSAQGRGVGLDLRLEREASTEDPEDWSPYDRPRLPVLLRVVQEYLRQEGGEVKPYCRERSTGGTDLRLEVQFAIRRAAPSHPES